MSTPITNSNFIHYAAVHYDSPFPDPTEFQEDLKRIVYIKRLFNLYQEKTELRERLILNHLIVLTNVFGQYALPMLFLKLEGHEVVLKTFLCYLNRMPIKIDGIGDDNRTINSQDIPLDPIVWQKLIIL